MTTTMRVAGAGVVALAFVYVMSYTGLSATEYRSNTPERFIPLPRLDTADYDARLFALAHVGTTTLATSTDAVATTSASLASSTPSLWPVKAVYPNAGAVLPFKRVVAYYGNYYSAQMGVLGEYPIDQMLSMLASTTRAWAAADPTTPVVPALEYIAVVAQGGAGKDGLYRLRMPDDQIEKTIQLADRIHGIVFLDIQVGQSTLQAELPLLERYLAMPQVNLAIDPEFSMKYGGRPGSVIGTFDANDANYAARYLASLVNQYHLPPKILVVHRFTEDMVTNYREIEPLPEVQVVMNMDGFGSKEKKRNTYSRVVYPEPVQFTGIKLFYKNDLKPPSDGMLTPAEILHLTPAPIYIQYQ